jgi:hypothetical protein
MTLDCEPLLAQAEILTLIFRELVERTDSPINKEEQEQDAAASELRHRRGYNPDAPDDVDGDLTSHAEVEGTPVVVSSATPTTTNTDLPRISDGLRELIT